MLFNRGFGGPGVIIAPLGVTHTLADGVNVLANKRGLPFFAFGTGVPGDEFERADANDANEASPSSVSLSSWCSGKIFN